MNSKKRIVSGITATGNLTIGNYLGAIKNFIKLQDKYEMFIFVADLHALTIDISPKTLKQNKANIMAIYIAAGLDPKNVVLFNQSDVYAHTMLQWILLNQTTMGVLSRITQFKEKSSKVKLANGTHSIPTGLFSYPTLMAADILLYSPDFVPVGIDQKQHLELTQNIARKFNSKYGLTFKIPDTLFPEVGAKIMSLTNPTKKMSKSSSNIKSYISLLDDPKIARKKIMSAITDSEGKIYISKEKDGITNLLQIYAGFSDIGLKDAEKQFMNKNYKELKEAVANVVCSFLEDLQNKYKKALNEINNVAIDGAQKANNVANKNIKIILNKIGM